MRLKILWISLIIIIFSFPSVCFSELKKHDRVLKIIPHLPDSKVWEYYGKISNGDIYYNKTNLTKSSDKSYVWIYQTVTDDYKKQRIEVIKMDDLELSEKFHNYDHSIMLSEIDCKNKKFRLKQMIDYDDKGDLLKNIIYDTDSSNFIPGSLPDTLYQQICVTEKKPLKKKKK